MIIDNIENSNLYTGIHPWFDKAFDFIKTSDFSTLKDGKYEIEGNDIFALVQQYETKDANKAKPESHFKYIDIQYMHSGSELMGVAIWNNQVPVTRDLEHDIAFYNEDSTFIKLNKGIFAIFFPHDLHMPGIKSGQSGLVKKVVIKVKM